MKKILTIIGPTGVGKTDLAVKIAEKINGEVIGLDSRQIYKHMAIGTAQPSSSDMNNISHHLIGCRDPWFPISAGSYAKMVIKKINEIKKRGSTPIICGGAGLYYRAIKKGIFARSKSDLELRQKLEKQYKKDPESLMLKLQEVDSQYAKIVHINNRKRLIRALEIFELTGDGPTKHFTDQKNSQNQLLNLYTVYLYLDKNAHINKIRDRTEKMIKNGWIEEVNKLLFFQKENNKIIPPLDSIGYKQIIEYLKGSIDQSTLSEIIITKTRQYAKKQKQWFEKEKIDLRIDITNLEKIDIHDYLNDIYKII